MIAWVLAFLGVVYHIDGLADAEPSLWDRDEPCLVVLGDLVSVSLNLVC